MLRKPVKSGLAFLAAFASACVRATLRQLIPAEDSIYLFVKETAFCVMRIDSFHEPIEQATQRIKFLSSSIALPSRIVGGVGLMKTMWITLVERTHAVAIGMAVGASRRDMLAQLPIGAGLMSLLGGTFGICLTLPLIKEFDRMTFFLPTFCPSHGAITSFHVSSIAEIISATLLADPTAGLDPIEALVCE